MRAAARRIAVLVAAVTLLTVVASALAGLALGSALDRAISTGLYLVGCFLIVLGFFAGVRGPLRPKGSDEEREPIGALLGIGIFATGARASTAEERVDARATAWLFIGLGFALLLVGLVVDGRVRLV